MFFIAYGYLLPALEGRMLIFLSCPYFASIIIGFAKLHRYPRLYLVLALTSRLWSNTTFSRTRPGLDCDRQGALSAVRARRHRSAPIGIEFAGYDAVSSLDGRVRTGCTLRLGSVLRGVD
ncbi:hypothetical protein DENSPDRAFT_413591 [Dentipellis sp. KUC8613]|nr:hypothetical protein DENSPDRAFT_413591 [Dentipellis sp. KUC8613]